MAKKKKTAKKSKKGKRKMSPAQKAALAKGRAVMKAKRAGKPAKAKKKHGHKKAKSKAKKSHVNAFEVVVHKAKGVAHKATGKVKSMKAGKMKAGKILKNPIVMKIVEGPVVGLSAWGSAKALSYLPVKNPVMKAGAQAVIGAVLSIAMGKMHPLVEKAGDGMYHAGIFGLQKAAFGVEAMAGEEDYSFAMMGEDVIQVTPAELASMQGEEGYSIAGSSENFAGTSESFAGVGGAPEWRVAV